MNFLIIIPSLNRLSALSTIALLLFFQTTLASAATLTSTVNRNSMNTNETLTLTVTLDEQAGSSELNINGLKKDFEILSMAPRNSTSISTVNGKTTRIATTKWTITLAAKREGNLRIPAFNIKQATSNIINIKALSAAQLKSGANAQASPLMATGLADKASVYPGQQLIYRIELSAAKNVSDMNGSPLEIPGASTELIGQQQYQRIDNGVARTVIILTYAIFAQDSGKLTIPSISFTGLIGGRRSVFGNQGQQVVGRSNELTIEVKAKPVNTNGSSWFPAEAVNIRSSWSTDPNSIQTGSPITRTITVSAQGQLATAIPPLTQTTLAQSSVKFYKDKPQLDSSKTTEGYNATRIESQAIVVNEPGNVTLPAITVDWFNVNKNQWEQATLAAETITVTGEAAAQSVSIITPTIPKQAPIVTQNSSANTHWLWPITTGLLSIICLIQAVFLIRRKPTSKPMADQNKRYESESERWKLLQKDLKKNDPIVVRRSIIEWLRTAHPNVGHISLNVIYNESNSNLSDSIKKLETSLFSNENPIKFEDFKLELKQQLEAYRKQLVKRHSSTQTKQSSTQLEALYPS